VDERPRAPKGYIVSKHIPKRFLGAFKKGHRKCIRPLIDDTFAYQLLERLEKSQFTDTEAEEALLYLARFNDEMHGNRFDEDESKHLHNTEELRQKAKDEHAARNKDVYQSRYYSLKQINQNEE